MAALAPMLELLSQQAIQQDHLEYLIPPSISRHLHLPILQRKNKKQSAVDVEDNIDGKRSKGNNYQENKLMELCRAWVAISEDSWVEELDPSGYVTQDQLDMTQDLYKKDQGKSYGHKNSKNRVEFLAATSDLPAPDSELTQLGLQSNNTELAQPEVQSGTVLKQPIGKKKAKALHRAKGKGVDNWKDHVATAQNEIAAQAKHQNDIFDREAALSESIAKTIETNAEMPIMNKDSTNCNKMVRRYFKLKQEVIIDTLKQSP
ncbi:hypothetical protein MJO28_005590 [Puccinia striiformis f. sp. tritici]|uniref:No apical meristem-associated C-terminal domain-containing protein n=3 Tax=Puccinia striiformis TaxID=27350 RepID=A0A2S4UZA0_9BASI|nr:hypothetical protein Pst134EA_009725 [Puccinia striiformis f. sp. tritici]KAH9469196.1 hypothetical protein Pst134EA_009725 [Puccinia striiformis f. sp. tritici]KAI7955190.1 hypothetical protein MJO28_005590 [Puccinia striiformis f. sp. tritici]POW02581.1 hypothetical protein PSTT_11686 [Puccinia striiformis]